MTLRRNILLFHQGALGDFVLTWPIALALARIHPQSRVFYVTHAQKGALAGRTLGVEWADAEAGWHPLFGDAAAELPEAPRRLLAGAHSVVSFLSAPGSAWAANVKRIAPEANVLTVNPTPPDNHPGHVTDYQREQLRPWPAAHAAAEQILRSVRARGLTVARPAATDPAPAARPVLIHPGSGSPAKNWPVDRYVELARRLSEERHVVRVLLGEVERERWPEQTVGMLERVGAVVWPSTLLGLMSELLAAGAFVGNDSGPGHLAATLGVPTLSLFGATDPARWLPLGPRVEALRAQPLDALAVDEVFERLRPLLVRRAGG
jgi:heptosyltransferase-3